MNDILYMFCDVFDNVNIFWCTIIGYASSYNFLSILTFLIFIFPDHNWKLIGEHSTLANSNRNYKSSLLVVKLWLFDWWIKMSYHPIHYHNFWMYIWAWIISFISFLWIHSKCQPSSQNNETRFYANNAK